MNRPSSHPTTDGSRSQALDAEWWRTAVGYEVYIRSFADGNGDGIGDLIGLHDRLDHLAWLGVDVVWITPFYPSPMVDYGYDVADYVDVDPRFGDLAAFDAVVARAHDLGMRVVIDIVPNHTSDQHPWFQQARSARDAPYRDFYLWRDPAPDGGPPNNWVGMFGGPAWTLDEATGQYYLHLFLPEQPDLDWANPAVQAAFVGILRFWLERGVDGFRIDVAHAMAKDAGLRDNPVITPVDYEADRVTQWLSLEHVHDVCQPASLDVFREWKELTAAHDAVLIGETYVFDAADLEQLLAPARGLDVGFWFLTFYMPWDAGSIERTLTGPPESVRHKVGWVQSSHDDHRPVTRFGGGARGRRRALGLSVLLLGLPGMPFLYQGEELGLEDGHVAPENKSDPVGDPDDPTSGRDGCRTPMPWTPGPGGGFSTTADTWLPIGHDDPRDFVDVQRADPDAIVHRYRALLAARRTLGLVDEPATFVDHGDGVVAFTRGRFIFALNAGEDDVDLSGVGVVRYHTAGHDGGVLPPDHAAIFESSS